MNALTTTAAALLMSSHEIAELVDKRHDNVMRDIRIMLVELHGDGGVLSFEDTQANPQNGQAYPVFMLPKRETMILVSGYSVTLRARIVDRWQELEAQVVPSGLKDFREVAKLLKANEARFREFLYERVIMYLLGGEWVAYQRHIDAGRFEVKAGTSPHSSRAFNRSMFTPKGVEWIAGLWAVEQLRADGCK